MATEHEHLFAEEGCWCGAQRCTWKGYTAFIDGKRYHAKVLPPEWETSAFVDQVITCEEEGPELCAFHRVLNDALQPAPTTTIIAEQFILQCMGRESLHPKVPKVRDKKLR